MIFIHIINKNYVSFFSWGAPARLLSDQGREFVAEVNTKVCAEFGIKRSVTSAYHPQTNGLDERTNQTLKTRLSKLANDQHNDWDQFLYANCSDMFLFCTCF
jgi:transposase InsO family protein